MKTKHTPWKVIAATTMVISGLLYAVAVFNPTSTPTVTLGEYAIKNRDLLDGPTKAYRSWFENGAWQGDLIEYQIGIDGSRSLNHTLVGSNDNTALIALASDTTKNWMARATFLKNEQNITDYWKEETTGGRRLFSYNGSAQVPFLWDNLTAAQKISLDADTISDPDGDGDPSDAVDPATSQSNNYFGPVFNFIRGDRSNERSQTDGTLRTRYSLLGDVTGTPVYIGPPKELFNNFDGYSGFRYANRNRNGVVATPANDGILHFFAEADGSESMGYIPSMVIENLFRLAVPSYEHTYYLDGEMFVTSAQVDPDHAACVDALDTNSLPVNVSACEWRTVLVSGGGAGFEGLFGLDLTTPTYSSDSVLFEKSGGDFGHIYGAPRIAPLGTAAAPDWYVFTGSGYKAACSGVNNSDCDTDMTHPTALLMVSLADPTTVHKIDTLTTGGLSSPALLSSDSTDLTVEIAFAGDINGDVWMFWLDKADPAKSTFRKVFDGVPNLPISNTPALVEHPDSSIGGYILYFGTGSIFSLEDTLNDAVDSAGNSLYKQAVYGIHIKKSWIDGTDTSFDPLENDDLQLQALNAIDPPISAFFANNGETKIVRTTPTTKPVNYACITGDTVCEANLKSGWRLELPICGERLVGAPFIRAKRMQFVTTNPTGLDCGGSTVAGDSWMMSLDYLTGSSANKVVFNLNGDTKLDALDTVSGVPPVGISLGEGNIAQPIFVRLRDGIDKMFVNGLILPAPPVPNPSSGPMLFGHIDVVTDSPSGGTTATNLIKKHSQGYQTADASGTLVDAPDGVSGAVDALFHDYDGANGVPYVDLLNLEPRRGLASLAPASDATNPVSTNPDVCSDVDDDKRILVGNKCIEAVEPELNRVAETYELGGIGSGLLDPDEEFMIVIANADLSTLGSLQVGCKIWEGGINNNGDNEFIELQNHIADELYDGTAPADVRDPKYNEPIIFTINSITNNTALNGTALSHICPEKSPDPTLRVLFDEDTIFRQGIHPTRSQCVLGLHSPGTKVCYSDPEVLEAANSAVLDTRTLIESNSGPYDDVSCASSAGTLPVPDRYIKDTALQLHVTPDAGGYRWRNGALTVQLLDPDTFVLQDENDMPTSGGTYARGFGPPESFSKKGNKITIFPKLSDANESGLMFEAAIFWHYSDFADNIQRARWASIPCFGDSNYKSAVNQESRGLTQGQYKVWADELEGTQILSDFAALLNIINNGSTSEAALNQALLDLNDLFNDATLGDILREYAHYRDYVPGSNVPTQHLLDIDKNLGDSGGSDNSNSSTADGVPADVVTIETIDLESLGPNAVLGKRNWIDLRQ